MKYQILMQLFIMLLANKRTTVKEIMARFDLPRRTVFRYVDTLCLAGIPVVSIYGRNGGFYIAPEFKLSTTFFTDEEKQKLVSILDEHLETNKDDTTAQNIKDKLTALVR